MQSEQVETPQVIDSISPGSKFLHNTVLKQPQFSANAALASNCKTRSNIKLIACRIRESNLAHLGQARISEDRMRLS